MDWLIDWLIKCLIKWLISSLTALHRSGHSCPVSPLTFTRESAANRSSRGAERVFDTMLLVERSKVALKRAAGKWKPAGPNRLAPGKKKVNDNDLQDLYSYVLDQINE
jgi:hypothetical protein